MAESLKIPREAKPDTFITLIKQLVKNKKVKVVVLFVNEDNCRQLVRASMDIADTRDIYWLASDSWGAKAVPVSNQEAAAEGTITILPTRNVLKGEALGEICVYLAELMGHYHNSAHQERAHRWDIGEMCV